MIFEGLHPFENNKADNLQEDELLQSKTNTTSVWCWCQVLS
jgi:hypothetical protein